MALMKEFTVELNSPKSRESSSRVPDWMSLPTVLFILTAANSAYRSTNGQGYRTRSTAGQEQQVQCWTQSTVVHNHLSHNNKQVEPPGLCDMTMPTQQALLGGCPLAMATRLRQASTVTFGELEECGIHLCLTMSC
ncbi:hypothetical protein AOLI_G00084580 [Acnodon oligacanthus]